MIRAKGGIALFMAGLVAALQADIDATVERFHAWVWERLAFFIGALIIGLTVLVVAAEVGRRWFS